MQRAIFLAATALLAGCAQPAPVVDEPHGPEVPQVPRRQLPPACATLTIDAPEVSRAGTSTTFNLTLANCGNTSIDLPPPPCSDPPRGFTLDVYPPGDDYGYTITSQGARRSLLPCEPSEEPPTQIAAGEHITITREWDLTDPAPACNARGGGGACSTTPARPGTYRLVALAPTDGRIFPAEATIRILPAPFVVPAIQARETFDLDDTNASARLTFATPCETGSLNEDARTIHLYGQPERVPAAVVVVEIDHGSSSPANSSAGSLRSYLPLIDTIGLSSLLDPQTLLLTLTSDSAGIATSAGRLDEAGASLSVKQTTSRDGASIHETLNVAHAGDYVVIVEDARACA